MTDRLVTLFLLALLAALPAWSQEDGEEGDGFRFEIAKQLDTTPVKNQSRTGTCWSFATSSFIETELIRMGKGRHDLSEMFAVRMIYPEKARRYVRYHGNSTLGSGSLSGDLLRVWREHGALPESVYDGRFVGQDRHNHAELDKVLKAMLDAVVSNPGKTLSPAWPEAVNGVLDAYLGAVPETFEYEGKTYTPRSFADMLGIDPGDYVELTSFAHHPFYTRIDLELPDNWAENLYYNVPLDELMAVLDRAIEKGYSVGWDGDTSERSFMHKKGVATMPAVDWEARDSDAQDALGDAPEEELTVTQAVRQAMFDNYATTDDHLMHIVGIATDQNGTRYYITKNSWGTLRSEFEGYLNMSEAYVRAKTVSILVHRDVLPAALSERLAAK